MDRMRVEGEALGLLRHPHLVDVFQFDYTKDGRPYLLMERLNGCTLRQELRTRKRLPVTEAVRYAQEMLAALSVAHARGIVHRDIKPENLFLHRQGGGRILKVLDLGIAKVLQTDARHAVAPLTYPTDKASAVGTPLYWAPEQASSQQVDGRADIYAVGLVLFEMLTGKPPVFAAHGAVQLGEAVLDGVPSIPAALKRAILRAVQPSPERRFASAVEFSAAAVVSAVSPAKAPWHPVLLVTAIVAAATYGVLRVAFPH